MWRKQPQNLYVICIKNKEKGTESLQHQASWGNDADELRTNGPFLYIDDICSLVTCVAPSAAALRLNHEVYDTKSTASRYQYQ